MKPWLSPTLLLMLSVLLAQADPRPRTRPRDWEEADLSARLMDGAHRFVERTIAEAKEKRTNLWTRDFSSPLAYANSVEANRARFKTIIGAVDNRLPASMEYYADPANSALVAETTRYRVYQVRWPVLEGLWGTGLLVEPRTTPVASAVVVSDAGQTPEQLLGLAPGIPNLSQGVRRLAENGFQLVLPLTVSRDKLNTDDPQLRNSDQTHREWIYRQAFHLGRHVIGYEVQTVLAAVDWMRTRHRPPLNIGVAGYAEGGLTAFYAAASDPRNLLDGDSSGYRNVAAALAERGFITFAPHNLYRGEDRYRWLDRKANTVKATLFSFIIASHDQILRWLDAQPFVDGSRIAFYGLSYGGETAMRVPPILERYCLSICSGDFNQWTRKVASTDEPFSFMRTIEWEMPYWNLGHTFDYAEMAYLMIPRPFRVERGHGIGSTRDMRAKSKTAPRHRLHAGLETQPPPGVCMGTLRVHRPVGHRAKAHRRRTSVP